jgi:hypothetical protein
MAAPTRPPRLLRIVLILSLALNLLVAGLVLGALLGGRDRMPPHRVDVSLGPLGRALTPPDRLAIAAEVRGRSEFRPLAPSERRRAMAETLAALRAQPFDPDALSAVLAAQRAAGTEALEIAQEVLVKRVSEMTAAERAALADRLETETRRSPDRRADKRAPERGRD